jgi:hypothetical protein
MGNRKRVAIVAAFSSLAEGGGWKGWAEAGEMPRIGGKLTGIEEDVALLWEFGGALACDRLRPLGYFAVLFVAGRITTE